MDDFEVMYCIKRVVVEPFVYIKESNGKTTISRYDENNVLMFGRKMIFLKFDENLFSSNQENFIHEHKNINNELLFYHNGGSIDLEHPITNINSWSYSIPSMNEFEDSVYIQGIVHDVKEPIDFSNKRTLYISVMISGTQESPVISVVGSHDPTQVVFERYEIDTPPPIKYDQSMSRVNNSSVNISSSVPESVKINIHEDLCKSNKCFDKIFSCIKELFLFIFNTKSSAIEHQKEIDLCKSMELP